MKINQFGRMKQNENKHIDLFEISWEVCNKTGGIHTVISSKVEQAQIHFDNYFLIGPLFGVEIDNPEFEEDTSVLRDWRERALIEEGLKIVIGRWKIEGSPLVILVDHTVFISQKDAIFARFWERYLLDSISGDWGYIEPALFGYAAGAVVAHYYKHFNADEKKTIAHFHEWMSGAGVLYLKEYAPEIVTVFTTHSTVIGRAIAEQCWPIHKDLESYNGEKLALQFKLKAKHSLEKASAYNADCFTAVSEATAKECQYLILKEPNFITFNGFRKVHLPEGEEYLKVKENAREKLYNAAENVLGYKLSENSLVLGFAGRDEMKNKGIDLVIDSLAALNNSNDLVRPVVAFLFIPFHVYGPRVDFVEDIKRNLDENYKYLTHEIHDANYNNVLNKLKSTNLKNSEKDKVKVIFVPSYLNGNDGYFNVTYYQLLVGLDLTLFPSYYEPWGYTPLESIVHKVPTISSSLSGFSRWVSGLKGIKNDCISVVYRDDMNYKGAIDSIVKEVEKYHGMDKKHYLDVVENTQNIYKAILWDQVYENYVKTYDLAIEKSDKKIKRLISKQTNPKMGANLNRTRSNEPQWKGMTVHSTFPEKFNELSDIAHNLWWTWNYEAVELFEEIDPKLWEEERNPILTLKEISYDRLKALEKDDAFLSKYTRVLKKYKEYINTPPAAGLPRLAYFSMEYGLDDTLKIFSGGLGVLAGDYLKEASDINNNLVAVGFLYKYGYFKQKLSLDGDQLAIYNPQSLSSLPIALVKDKDGNQVIIQVGLPGRIVNVRIWLTMVGRVKLYLLDTNFSDNSDEDKAITNALYGGGNEDRLRQEIILGIGGVRALEAVGEKPDLFHCNEGHAAFINVERLRKYIKHQNLSFQEALEMVRTSTLYTTHTPVPAGHDSFPEDLMMTYLGQFPERLQLSWNEFMNLGRMYADNHGEHFNMSHFALNTCQEANGVSRLHGKVSKDMFQHMWKGYEAEENHIGYVTNGVHYGTWTAKAWRQLYEDSFGDKFLNNQSDSSLWSKIENISDAKIWSIRQSQRELLLNFVKQRLHESWIQRYEDPKKLLKVFNSINKNTLTIGFARRFATYKRAYLLFSNIEKLAKIVNNPERPVQFLFAGKAHPNDKPGQNLIKEIVKISKMPEFEGKVIFLENYDMTLAKRLVQGVDIWLNTPTRPLEASGTSGMKAVMNGALNFSVLDGWWCEGYVEKGGWSLPEEKTYEDDEFQNKIDAEMLYSTLEYEILPIFYTRDADNIPREWVKYVKKSIGQIAPQFTTKRMIDDYTTRYYSKLWERTKKMTANNYALAKEISDWKRLISENWENIEITSFDFPDNSNSAMKLGVDYEGSVSLNIKGLKPDDIGIEFVITQPQKDGGVEILDKKELVSSETVGNVTKYSLVYKPSKSGIFNFGLRMYPKNPNLPHRQDFSYVRWL